MSLYKEFKEFVIRGNVVDLAVGVIIGVGFGKIVSSLVNDVIMPPIGKVMGGVDFKELFYNLDPSLLTKAGGPVKTLADARDAGAAVIAYGSFINTVIDFTIVALCIFLVIQALNAMKRKPVPVAAPSAPELSREGMILSEIRDVLKARA
jgi:large conductance mechanosensitive channel